MARQHSRGWLKSISLATLMTVAGVMPSQIVFANPAIVAQVDRATQLVREAVQLMKEGSVESLRQAIGKLEQMLILSQQASEERLEAMALVGLGKVYSDLGEVEQALEYYDQALPLHRALGDRQGEATTLNNLGGLYSDLGEVEQALEYYDQALPLYRVLEDRQGEAITLSNLGVLYDSLGEKQQALEYYNQALPVLRAVGDRQGEATTLSNLGVLYDSLGEVEQALEYYDQALPLHRALGDRQREATTLNSLGGLYDFLGEKEQALEYYHQALPLRRVVGDRSGEANALISLGFLYHSQEEMEQAIEYTNQALSLFRAVGNRSGEAATLNTLGRLYRSQGEMEQALESTNQALSLTRAIGDRREEATALNNLGEFWGNQGEIERAIEYTNQALPLTRAVGDRQNEANTLSHLAYLESNQNNLETSLTHIQESIAILEDLRSNIGSQDLRASFFATVQDNYQFYIDLLMELHQQNPGKGYDAQALHISERSRARGLLELLTEANANIRQGADPQLLAQEQVLLQKLNTLEQQRYDLASAGNQEQAQALQPQIERVLQELDRLEAQIRTTSPRYANLKYPQPLTLEQIQQQVLDEGTALLQYSLGKERSFLWVVTKEGMTSHVLPPRAEIEKASNNMRRWLIDRNVAIRNSIFVQFSKASEELSDLILSPAIRQLGNSKRLVIVPDGALHYIPFSTLALPESTEYEPLLKQYEIVNLPSSSSLAITRNQVQGRSPAPQNVAILADPVFSAEDERLTSKAQANANPQSISEELAQSRLERTLRDSSVELKRIPFTRTEAENILAITPESSKIFLDFEANLKAAQSSDLSQYRVIHLATHGLLNVENPELSGIVFSLINEQGQTQNGFLQLAQIFNLDLPAELIVLSACETGTGENIRGEGMVGLTRGFMYAGSPRVLASLWKVDDQSTATLMTEFYQYYLQEGLTPAQALRQAQLAMWENKEGTWQPYYWSAFVLQGEWR